jgi:predicted DNA-binding protein (MmcQ/YjbR family)
MDIDSIRKHCMGFPHATENVQWGADLCFKVEGKMFAVASLEVGPVRLSFKCTPENFAELCERQGIIPAPYLARAQWVALKSLSAVPDAELRELLAESYWLVWQRLPKGRWIELTIPPVVAVKTASSKKKKKKAAPSSPVKRKK